MLYPGNNPAATARYGGGHDSAPNLTRSCVSRKDTFQLHPRKAAYQLQLSIISGDGVSCLLHSAVASLCLEQIGHAMSCDIRTIVADTGHMPTAQIAVPNLLGTAKTRPNMGVRSSSAATKSKAVERRGDKQSKAY